MLDHAELSKNYWAFAVSGVVYLTNLIPTRSVVGKTRYEAWHGRKPSLKHLRAFGCLAFVHVLKEKRKNLDYRATPGIFVGYSISSKQYFVYHPFAKTLHSSRDVVFRVGKSYTAMNAADETILNEHFYRDVIQEPKPKPTEKQPNERQMVESLDDDPPYEPPKPTKKPLELAGLETSLGDAWKPPAEGSSRNHSGKDTFTESAQLDLEDEEFEDMIPLCAAAAIFDNQDGIDDPKS
jgi:hypothetical protein